MGTISRLLIANRGEIARRITRAAHARGIEVVLVASTPDLDALAALEADLVVHLPGAAPVDTYLNVAEVVGAAVRTHCDAVHPGYGFLSENATFARAVLEAGLTFIGPAPETIEQMGSKLSAKATMAHAGVPVLAGGPVSSAHEVMELASSVGWPLLLKASAGGGGRGMRVLRSEADLEVLESAIDEARSAFGDGTVFVERFIERPRHLEVQIVGDRFGTVADLFERECSIQRRYQKIIEEAPAANLSEETREVLRRSARTAAQALSYLGVGTVEFIVDEDGSVAFLEINTRLQVEHPVTEIATGIDLVDLQFDLAEGRALPQEVLEAKVVAHGIEARLYAEDPLEGYLPQAGRLERFELAEAEGIRVDTGVASGSLISPFYDPMLAKVSASGPTRAIAIARLRRALERAQLHGTATNRDLLVGIVAHPGFTDEVFTTAFLEEHPAEVLVVEHPLLRPLHAAAVALADQAWRHQSSPFGGAVPSGFRNVVSAPQQVTFTDRHGALEVSYRLSRAGVEVAIDGVALEVSLVQADANQVRLEHLGTTYYLQVARYGDLRCCDSVLGSTQVEVVGLELDATSAGRPGTLVAPMPGTITAVQVEVGQSVEAGQVVLVLEAMKMQHAITAPTDGVVAEICHSVGQVVEARTVLVVLEEERDG